MEPPCSFDPAKTTAGRDFPTPLRDIPSLTDLVRPAILCRPRQHGLCTRQGCRSAMEIGRDLEQVVKLGRGVFFPSSSTMRSEEHTSELQSLMRISYAVFCLKK